MLSPARFEQFAKAFVAETNRQRMTLSATKSSTQAALIRVERQIKRLVDAIVEGADALPLNTKLKELDAEKTRLTAELEPFRLRSKRSRSCGSSWRIRRA